MDSIHIQPILITADLNNDANLQLCFAGAVFSKINWLLRWKRLRVPLLQFVFYGWCCCSFSTLLYVVYINIYACVSLVVCRLPETLLLPLLLLFVLCSDERRCLGGCSLFVAYVSVLCAPLWLFHVCHGPRTIHQATRPSLSIYTRKWAVEWGDNEADSLHETRCAGKQVWKAAVYRCTLTLYVYCLHEFSGAEDVLFKSFCNVCCVIVCDAISL